MIYEKIENLCEEKGIKITNLCKEITKSPGNLIAWKKDSFKPAVLTKIADYFNCSVDYLLGKEKSSPETEELENIISYHRDGQTIRKQLTKKQMDAIHAMIETMKESDEDL